MVDSTLGAAFAADIVWEALYELEEMLAVRE